MLLLMVHPSLHIFKLFLKFTPLVTVRGRDYSYKEINFEFFNPLKMKNFVLDILSLFNFYLKALLVSLLLYFNSSKFVGDEYFSDAFYILNTPYDTTGSLNILCPKMYSRKCKLLH